MTKFVSVILQPKILSAEADEIFEKMDLKIEWICKTEEPDEKQSIGVISVEVDNNEQFNQLLEQINQLKIIEKAHEPKSRKRL